MCTRRRFLVAAATCFAGGCAARSYVEEDRLQTGELRVRAGDRIRIVTIDRERLSFRVDEVLTDRFVGTTGQPGRKETRPEGERVVVPYDRIVLIEVTGFDARTAAVVGAAAVFTVALGVLLVTGIPVVVLPP
jgi:hypothetical protein